MAWCYDPATHRRSSLSRGQSAGKSPGTPATAALVGAAGSRRGLRNNMRPCAKRAPAPPRTLPTYGRGLRPNPHLKSTSSPTGIRQEARGAVGQGSPMAMSGAATTPSAASLRHCTLWPGAFTQGHLRVATQHVVEFRGPCTAFGVRGVAFPQRRDAEARSTREHRSRKESR
jgi:hypothetical protein